MKNILFIALAISVLVSCKKSNIGDHQNYIGYWRNYDGSTMRTFDVKSDGQSLYEETTSTGGASKTVSYGGKFILEGTSLKIGLKNFTINKVPELKNGIWYFTMDNVEYSGK